MGLTGACGAALGASVGALVVGVYVSLMSVGPRVGEAVEGASVGADGWEVGANVGELEGAAVVGELGAVENDGAVVNPEFLRIPHAIRPPVALWITNGRFSMSGVSTLAMAKKLDTPEESVSYFTGIHAFVSVA